MWVVLNFQDVKLKNAKAKALDRHRAGRRAAVRLRARDIRTTLKEKQADKEGNNRGESLMRSGLEMLEFSVLRAIICRVRTFCPELFNTRLSMNL